nr:hypothetical protein [Tanacetum cinerariifolium]
TYNLDQTVRYSANYNQMTANKINVVEEYSQEDSDFLLLEEADAFLGLEDDPDSTKINPFYYDSEGDILLLEAILNSEPSPPLPNQDQNLPSFKEELKAYETQTVKSSIEEPTEVELKDLPHHLEYAFLEGDDKLPVIIAKELRSEEKAALIKEADAFLGLDDDPNLLKINPFYYDPEGDILLLETILNSEPLPPLPNHEQYMPLFKKELKVCEAKIVKSSVDEPPEDYLPTLHRELKFIEPKTQSKEDEPPKVEHKELPSHLEYAFLGNNGEWPVIIAKDLSF